jgi:hypothetical protein
MPDDDDDLGPFGPDRPLQPGPVTEPFESLWFPAAETSDTALENQMKAIREERSAFQIYDIFRTLLGAGAGCLGLVLVAVYPFLAIVAYTAILVFMGMYGWYTDGENFHYVLIALALVAASSVGGGLALLRAARLLTKPLYVELEETRAKYHKNLAKIEPDDSDAQSSAAQDALKLVLSSLKGDSA